MGCFFNDPDSSQMHLLPAVKSSGAEDSGSWRGLHPCEREGQELRPWGYLRHLPPLPASCPCPSFPPLVPLQSGFVFHPIPAKALGGHPELPTDMPQHPQQGQVGVTATEVLVSVAKATPEASSPRPFQNLSKRFLLQVKH